jgi:hypothetical protein
MRTIGQFIEDLEAQLYDEDALPVEKYWNEAIYYVLNELKKYDKTIDLESVPLPKEKIDDIILENQRLVELVMDLRTTVRCLAIQLAESTEDFAVC